MGEHLPEYGNIDQPEPALERLPVAPKSGLLSWLHSVRHTAGMLMLAGATMAPDVDGAEKLDTTVEAIPQSLDVAIVKYHPKDTRRPMMVKTKIDGATMLVKDKVPAKVPTFGTHFYFDSAKQALVSFVQGKPVPVTIVDESKLPKHVRVDDDLQWQQERAARIASIISAPLEQGTPLQALQESPLEEVVPVDQILVGSKVYEAQRQGAEYSCDVPAITLEVDGVGTRAPSMLPPVKWNAELRDVDIDLMFQAKGDFAWSYLVPLPPDVGDQKRIVSHIDVTVGSVFKGKRSIVTDIVVTQADTITKRPRQAFARISMRSMSADAREIPVKLHMRHWVAMPEHQEMPENMSDPTVQNAIRLRALESEKPKHVDGFRDAEYVQLLAPHQPSRVLAAKRLEELGRGYVVTGWNAQQNRVENRYVTPSHIQCDTAVYASNDSSFIPLSFGVYGALPKVEGLTEEYAKHAQPLDLFLGTKGDAYFRPSMQTAKMSVSTPYAGIMAPFLKDEKAPDWVTEKVIQFASQRQKVNTQQQLAAAEKPAGK